MPISYNPGISYRGDQYTYNGLAGLGQGLGQALTDYQQKRAAEQQKIEELQREKQKNDIILGTYKELGLLKPEEHSAYMSAPIKQQSAMAAGFGERVALNYAMQSNAAKAAQAAVEQQYKTALTNRINNPIPPQPRYVSPRTGKPATVDGKVVGVYNEQGGIVPARPEQGQFKPQPVVVTDPVTGKPVTSITTSRNSAEIVKQGEIAGNSDAVKMFNQTVGNTYGVKAADLFQVDMRTPAAIKYVDTDNKSISTEQATKLGYGATAVVKIGDREKRIPLPEWNTIVNQWQQLPRAGGVTVQGGGDKAVQEQNIPRVRTKEEARALPPGTAFYDPEGRLRTR